METGSYPCEVSFNTWGGGPAQVKLTFTLTVEKLDITNATISVNLDSDKSTYNGQGQTPNISAVHVNSTTIGSVWFDVALVDDSSIEAETRTDAGTYKIRLTAQEGEPITGTVTLESPLFVIEKARPTIEWAADAAETLTYTGKAAELTAKPTVTDMASYDGEAITYSYAAAAGAPIRRASPRMRASTTSRPLSPSRRTTSPPRRQTR